MRKNLTLFLQNMEYVDHTKHQFYIVHPKNKIVINWLHDDRIYILWVNYPFNMPENIDFIYLPCLVPHFVCEIL